MTWDIIAALGAWAGALAVIATLFYLARQIQLNTEQLKLQLEESLRNRAVIAYDPIYEGRNAEIFFNGLYSPADLSETDRFVFGPLMSRHMGAIAVIGDQFRKGNLSSGEKDAYVESYRNMLFSSEGGKTWIAENGHNMQGYFKLLGLHEGARVSSHASGSNAPGSADGE